MRNNANQITDLDEINYILDNYWFQRLNFDNFGKIMMKIQ